MPEKDKKLFQRAGHGMAAVTVNSDCVEVIRFGEYSIQALSIVSVRVIILAN